MVEWARRPQFLFPWRHETEVWSERGGGVTQSVLFALRVRWVWKMSAREGKGTPISSPAVLTVCCRVFRQWRVGVRGAVQPPHHRVISHYQPAGRNSVGAAHPLHLLGFLRIKEEIVVFVPLLASFLWSGSSLFSDEAHCCGITCCPYDAVGAVGWCSHMSAGWRAEGRAHSLVEPLPHSMMVLEEILPFLGAW